MFLAVGANIRRKKMVDEWVDHHHAGCGTPPSTCMALKEGPYCLLPARKSGQELVNPRSLIVSVRKKTDSWDACETCSERSIQEFFQLHTSAIKAAISLVSQPSPYASLHALVACFTRIYGSMRRVADRKGSELLSA
mmetsp:Transcript_47825/g.94369  ORF Transcript_47825/g.94369 Transcript_47825/m.94369 type:complete len:137 (+) Transcript_47825:314-724(+)